MLTIKSQCKALLLLLIVSIIWGMEFVLIDMAVDIIPANSFNSLRFLLAAAALFPLLFYVKEATITRHNFLKLITAGCLLGTLLFIGFYGQTEGLRFTSVSNAGFITGLNVPLVPVLGFMFFRSKLRKSGWLAVTLATLGLYLLTVGDKLIFNSGDLLVLICAFAFAAHILFTGFFVRTLPITKLSIIQMLAVAFYSAVAAYFSDSPLLYHAGNKMLGWQDLVSSTIVMSAILTSAILATAFAFWVQSVCQTIIAPHKVALIFTAEPVFAYLTAWWVLDERLGVSGLLGAGLIMAAMLIAELGDRKKPLELKPLDHSVSVD